ncbi:MAG: SDR family oxidoreductase [Planctomycetota bacterium]|jgi:nucleoside-diphosphate-sugar epimerase
MNSEATNKRIAIIGCGYVGCALGETLVRAGHDVIGTTISPQRVAGIEARGIRPVVLEHAQTDRLHTLLSDCDAVYLTLAAGRKRGDYRKVYLEGVKNLLQACEGTPVKRIIYTSSTQVYGQENGTWVDESSPTEPQTENGRILLAAEQALLEGTCAVIRPANRPAAGFSTPTGGPRRDSRSSDNSRSSEVCATVVRLGGIHGPGRDLIERVRAAADKERSDADAYVNLIHRDDIVTALVRLLEVPYGGVLNLTDDTPIQRRELYDRIITAADLPPVRWTMGDVSPSLGKRVRNTLIKRTLGLTLQYPGHASPATGRSPS